MLDIITHGHLVLLECRKRRAHAPLILRRFEREPWIILWCRERRERSIVGNQFAEGPVHGVAGETRKEETHSRWLRREVPRVHHDSNFSEPAIHWKPVLAGSVYSVVSILTASILIWGAGAGARSMASTHPRNSWMADCSSSGVTAAISDAANDSPDAAATRCSAAHSNDVLHLYSWKDYQVLPDKRA